MVFFMFQGMHLKNNACISGKSVCGLVFILSMLLLVPELSMHLMQICMVPNVHFINAPFDYKTETALDHKTENRES